MISLKKTANKHYEDMQFCVLGIICFGGSLGTEYYQCLVKIKYFNLCFEKVLEIENYPFNLVNTLKKVRSVVFYH